MRCKNNCGNMTKTPNRVECYKKFGKCRPCCIKEGLVKTPKKGLVIRATKIKGVGHAKGNGHAFRVYTNKIKSKTNKWLNTTEKIEMKVLGRKEF